MSIVYSTDVTPTAEQYIDALVRSTLGPRRPIHDPALIAAALAGSDIIVTAWHAETLVGFARAITDFHLHCYLADLGVDVGFQRKGIGTRLQRILRDQLGASCKVKLSAAPSAAEYYAALGYSKNDRAWELPPGAPLRGDEASALEGPMAVGEVLGDHQADEHREHDK